MSFDNSDMLGAFTELEIAAGIPDLVFGTNRGGDGGGFGYDFSEEGVAGGDEPEDAWRSFQIDRKLSAARISARCNSTDILKMELIKKILNDEVGYIIRRYSKKEGLPDIYHELVRQDQCLEVLTKGMLGKVANINITSSLQEDVKNTASVVSINENMDTPYRRVGAIQDFIHKKVDESYGPGASRRLPVKHMRNLLSAARLHLSIKDILKMDASYLNRIIQKCAAEAEEEDRRAENNDSSSPVFLESGKRFYPKWRVRHLRHASYYSKESTRELISAIQEVDETGYGEKAAREKIVSLYISHDPRF